GGDQDTDRRRRLVEGPATVDPFGIEAAPDAVGGQFITDVPMQQPVVEHPEGHLEEILVGDLAEDLEQTSHLAVPNQVEAVVVLDTGQRRAIDELVEAAERGGQIIRPDELLRGPAKIFVTLIWIGVVEMAVRN